MHQKTHVQNVYVIFIHNRSKLNINEVVIIIEWVNKLYCLHTVEYFTVINKNKFAFNMNESHRHIKGKKLVIYIHTIYSTYINFQTNKIHPQFWKSEWFLLLGLTDWKGDEGSSCKLELLILIVVTQVCTYLQIHQSVYLKFMYFTKCNCYLSIFFSWQIHSGKEDKKDWWYIPLQILFFLHLWFRRGRVPLCKFFLGKSWPNQVNMWECIPKGLLEGSNQFSSVFSFY